jgi:hypothetical protein
MSLHRPSSHRHMLTVQSSLCPEPCERREHCLFVPATTAVTSLYLKQQPHIIVRSKCACHLIAESIQVPAMAS